MFQYCLDILKETGSEVKIAYRPRIDRVELEITTDCNLKCFHCNRLCGSAPSTECMSVGQIEKFVEESIRLKKRWNQIVIMGGEPCLHPNLKEILELIKKYRRFHANARYVFCTNGMGPKIREALRIIPKFFFMSNTARLKKSIDKEKTVPDFGNVLLAPIDRMKGEIRSCQIAGTCGLGLNRYGYVTCGCGAAMNRVLGLDIGIKRLEEVTVERCSEQLKILCAFCGRNLEYEIKCKRDSSISPFWVEALQRYKNKKPDMDPY